MRNATKILLIISEVVSFVLMATYLIWAILFFVAASLPAEELLQALIESGETGTDINMIREVQFVMLVFAYIFLFAMAFCIPSAILCIKCRKEFLSGKSSKSAMKPKAIALIVCGALSCELPVVPAIFLLAMNEKCYKL